jgi:hypothetical protein
MQDREIAFLSLPLLYLILPYLSTLFCAKKGERLYAFFGFLWLSWFFSFFWSICYGIVSFNYENAPFSHYILGWLLVTAFIPNLFGVLWLRHKYKKYKSKKMQNINRRN